MKPDYIDFVLSEEQKQERAEAFAERDAAVKRKEEAEHQLHHAQEQDAIRALVQDSGPFVTKSAEEAARKLAGKQLKLENGGLLVTDTDGSPLVGQHGLMSAAEFIEKFRQEHAYLTKSASSAPAVRENGVSDERLKTLFGAESVGKEAQKLATENLAEYRRLRTIAKERGIL